MKLVIALLVMFGIIVTAFSMLVIIDQLNVGKCLIERASRPIYYMEQDGSL